MGTQQKIPGPNEWEVIKKSQDNAPDIATSQEIIYDESGLQIGETQTLEILNPEPDTDPRNSTGKFAALHIEWPQRAGSTL